jgi:hypothetical protein
MLQLQASICGCQKDGYDIFAMVINFLGDD